MSSNIEQVEMYVIGSCIQSNRAADEVLEIIEPEMMLMPSNRRIMAAVSFLRSRRMPSEFLAVMTHLRENVSGSAIDNESDANAISEYLIQCATYADIYANASHYAGVVRGMWIRREIARIGELSHIPEVDTADLVAEMSRLASSGTSVSPAKFSRLGDFKDSPVNGTGSGFSLLDDNTTTGGWPAGQVSLVMAGTGDGKTMAMLQSAIEICQMEGPVLYMTLADLSGSQLKARAISSFCGWMRRPKYESGEQASYDEATKKVSALDIDGLDSSYVGSKATVEYLCNFIRSARTPYKAIFVDYAQKMRTSDSSVRASYDVAAKCSQELGLTAIYKKVPIILGSQITTTEQGTITKGGRTWEEDAGLVLRLQRINDEAKDKMKDPLYKNVKGLTRATITKNRFGPDQLSAWWDLQGKYARFEEL